MIKREINLLPPSRRQQLRNESVIVSLQRFVRTINSGLLVLSIIAIVATLLLTMALLVLSRGDASELTAALTDYQELRDDILKQDTLFSRVANIGENRIVWSSLLRQMLPLTPAGTTIHSLAGTATLDKDAAITQANVSISGAAATRTTLLLFTDRLAGLTEITNVVSPTTNLLDRTNLTYQLTLDLVDNDTPR